MNKNELISSVAQSTGYTKKDTSVVIDSLFDTILNTVSNGEDVSIFGFGKFTISNRSEHRGVNPQTGEEIIIAAHKSPKFVAGTNFKSALI